MSVTATVVHSLPHRVRLRFSDKRGDARYLAALAEGVHRVSGVKSVKPNAATSSMVVEFSCTLDELAARLREHGVDVPLQTIRRGVASSNGAVELRRKFPVAIVTGRDINPMFMAGAALAALAVIQTLRGRVLVPSVTALWYASEAFLRSGRRKQ